MKKKGTKTKDGVGEVKMKRTDISEDTGTADAADTASAANAKNAVEKASEKAAEKENAEDSALAAAKKKLTTLPVKGC